MEGVIKNFRRGRHRTSHNQMIVCVAGINSREEAQKLVGKSVEWKSPGKKTIPGTIAAPHGNKGALRVVFERGMPGQAIGTKVKINA